MFQTLIQNITHHAAHCLVSVMVNMFSTEARQVCSSLIVSLVNMLGGASIPLSSIIIPEISLNSDEVSWFASIITLGILIGSLAGCIYCDHIGRRTSLIIDCFGFIVGFCIMGFGENGIIVLCAGRFLTGFFYGTMHCSMMVYICEFSQPHLRGLMGGLNVLFFAIGFTVPFLLNMVVHWTVVTMSLCLPAVLSILGLALLDESPVWLARKRGDERARASLIFFRGDKIDIGQEIEEIKSNVSSTKENTPNKLSKLKNKKFFKPFIYLSFVMIANEWSSYPVLGTYMITIFQQTGSTFDPKVSSLIVCFVRIFFAAFNSSLLLRFPRRTIYLLATSLTCLSLFILAGFCYASKYFDLSENLKILPLICIIFIYIGFSLGYGTIPIILQGEIFAPHMRSLGCGIILCLQMISCFVAIKSSASLIYTIGLHGLFGLYSLVVFTVLLVAFFLMPETKDRTLADIQSQY